MKGIYAGKPMLIVGNGPSLNDTPLEEFIGVPSIGMNKIDLIYSRTRWRPSMIFCSNTMVVKQHKDSFESTTIPLYLSWKSSWLMRKNNPKIFYYNTYLKDDFQVDAARGIGLGATVTYAALQFAYYMGANPIVLVGIDHTFDKSADSLVYEKREGIDVNHFDPNYFPSGSSWGLPLLGVSEENYVEARQVFELDGRNIFDATINGKLEVFQKISIDEALALMGRTL
jgi:hypothetical protein